MSIDGATTEGQFVQALTTFNMWACQKVQQLGVHCPPGLQVGTKSKTCFSSYNERFYMMRFRPHAKILQTHIIHLSVLAPTGPNAILIHKNI